MKTPGYMVALSFETPDLSSVNSFPPPSIDVYGPVEFLFPPDKWMDIMTSQDGKHMSLEVFAKDEKQVEQAKLLLTKKFNKVIKKWMTELEKWGMDFENSLREK